MRKLRKVKNQKGEYYPENLIKSLQVYIKNVTYASFDARII